MNRALPKVSVITITYGHEKYIRETLDGVLMQQYDGPVEFIIANDNSPDATDEVVKKYFLENPAPSNFEIKYTKHETNKGMMPNFVWALEQATGKYIALCEGDDYWTDPLKLQKQVDFLEANPEYVLTFHPVQILKPDGSMEKDFITKVPENYELQETLARENNYIHTPSVLFRNIIQSFPPEFALSPIGDYFLYMILTNHGKIKMLEGEMAVYRYGVGVFSSQSLIKSATTSIQLYGLLLSYSNNEKINRMFYKKQMDAVGHLEKFIRREYAGSFISNHILFRSLNALRDPKTIWAKIKSRL